MSERPFRLPPLERTKPGPMARVAARVHAVRSRLHALAVTLALVAFTPTALHSAFGSLFGTVSLTDFTQIWAWLLVGGIAIIAIVVVAGYMATGVGPKKIAGGVGVGLVVVLIAFVGAQVSVVSTGSIVNQCLPSQGCTAAVSVSLPNSANYPTGQTLNLNPLSVTVDTVMNATTAAGAMCLQNGVGATHACAASAHNYIVLPVKLSRTDNYNATAGFTICINGISTLTNSSTGIVYSSLGYVAATTSSPGIWKVQWNTGSIGGANPTNPAPATLSGVACDLVGVPAFSSATVVLSISLPGSNSTSANFGYLATQYSNYGFTLAVSGGSGATPASVPVNIVFTGVKNA